MRAAMLDPYNARHSSSITARNLMVAIGRTREREINQQQPSELTTALPSSIAVKDQNKPSTGRNGSIASNAIESFPNSIINLLKNE